MGRAHVSLAQRAQALALLEENVPWTRILERTGLTRSTLYNIRKRAEERGYDKDRNFIFRNEFFEDNRRSGRAGEKEGKEKNLFKKKCTRPII